MTKKATFQLEGCETRIRQACDTTMSQKDWCEVWERAKADALKGKTALLLCLLPVVARKMQDSQPQVVINHPAAIPAPEVQAMQSESIPRTHANA